MKKESKFYICDCKKDKYRGGGQPIFVQGIGLRKYDVEPVRVLEIKTFSALECTCLLAWHRALENFVDHILPSVKSNEIYIAL